jgi:hypothetical protein
MSWLRSTAALVALTIASTSAVAPCAAAEGKPASEPPATRSLSAAAADHVARVAPPARFTQDASAAPAGGETRTFFRTPTGVAAIVLMAVGGGYAIYSVSHDQKPVKSPIR